MSAVYNKAIATRNTELIVNSVVVLFVMEMDEYIFAALKAVNEKWAAHAEDNTIDKMKKEIDKQIESQQEELRKLRVAVHKMTSRYASVIQTHNRWNRSMRLMQKIQESQVAAQQEQNANQREEIRQRIQEARSSQQEIANQREDLRVLCETVQRIREEQAAVAATAAATTIVLCSIISIELSFHQTTRG